MRTPIVRRVVVTVLDGLRPDAIGVFALPTLEALIRRGRFTDRATTVSPSVTAAAMGSLVSGVVPQHHGLTSDRFHLPRPRGPVTPLPALVAEAGLPATGFVRELPRLFRPLGRLIASRAGFTETTFAGHEAEEIVEAAGPTLRAQRDGLVLIHLPDADVAGHEAGWMSAEYGEGCHRLDAALATIVAACGALDDPETLLIVLADHGGGGERPHDHEGDHPLNLGIPMLLLGGLVEPGALPSGAHLLDVAPTAADALGLAAPSNWTGRSLVECIAPARAA